MVLPDTEWLGPAGQADGFEILVRRYLSWREVRGYSQLAAQGVRSTLRGFARWCLERGITRPAEVTFPMLQRYQRWLFYHRTAKGRALSLRTQAYRLAHVRSFFRWLVREHYILYNPASEIELPKYPRKLPHDVLSVSEVEAILASVDLSTPQGIRDRAILEVLYATGVRRFEAAKLDVYDIDRERSWLAVREGKGGRDRVVPLGERALAWVLHYVEDVRSTWVVSDSEKALWVTAYGERLSKDGLGNLVRQRVIASGVRSSGACHLFRHTMATLMLENGADIRFIQEMLGHSKLETTEIYTRVSIRHLHEIHAATHPGAKLARTRTANDDDIVDEDLAGDALAGDESEASGA